jgi:hypothetical protein
MYATDVFYSQVFGRCSASGLPAGLLGSLDKIISSAFSAFSNIEVSQRPS